MADRISRLPKGACGLTQASLHLLPRNAGDLRKCATLARPQACYDLFAVLRQESGCSAALWYSLLSHDISNNDPQDVFKRLRSAVKFSTDSPSIDLKWEEASQGHHSYIVRDARDAHGTSDVVGYTNPDVRTRRVRVAPATTWRRDTGNLLEVLITGPRQRIYAYVTVVSSH